MHGRSTWRDVLVRCSDSCKENKDREKNLMTVSGHVVGKVFFMRGITSEQVLSKHAVAIASGPEGQEKWNQIGATRTYERSFRREIPDITCRLRKETSKSASQNDHGE
ncbi:hypothetical protein Tco_0634068 [Tanacetum coccineum]